MDRASTWNAGCRAIEPRNRAVVSIGYPLTLPLSIAIIPGVGLARRRRSG